MHWRLSAQTQVVKTFGGALNGNGRKIVRHKGYGERGQQPKRSVSTTRPKHYTCPSDLPVFHQRTTWYHYNRIHQVKCSRRSECLSQKLREIRAKPRLSPPRTPSILSRLISRLVLHTSLRRDCGGGVPTPAVCKSYKSLRISPQLHHFNTAIVSGS